MFKKTDMKYYGLSDIGLVREENQDYCVAEKICNNAYLFVVCDGMGGANGGKYASRTACSVFVEQMKLRLSKYLESEKLPKRVSKDIPRYMEDSLAHTNTRIFELSQENDCYQGMGTTLVAMFVIDERAFVINVGDSRAYYFSCGNLLQITKDHSYVQFLIDSGKISREEALSHPQKNVITRSVGAYGEIKADIFELELKYSESVLLCTDGLTNFVDFNKILEIISNNDDLKVCVETLVALAKSGGGRDNITAILVENSKG